MGTCHALVQALVDSGAVTAADARRHPQRSIVVDAINGQPRPAPDATSLKAVPGDRLLFCSDGLSDVIDDDEIATALQIQSPEDCARTLIDLALRAGSRDNISVSTQRRLERRSLAPATNRESAPPAWIRPPSSAPRGAREQRGARMWPGCSSVLRIVG
jgi:serine/threonine protein phosphatase PrpC